MSTIENKIGDGEGDGGIFAEFTQELEGNMAQAFLEKALSRGGTIEIPSMEIKFDKNGSVKESGDSDE